MISGGAPPDGRVLYAEDWCALRWPLVLNLVGWPVLLAASIAAVALTRNPGLSFLVAIAFLGAVFGVVTAAVNWPVCIRVTDAGVSIGGLRRHHRHRAGAKLPPASAQRTQVFACPWAAVHGIEVRTGRASMKELAGGRRRGGMLALGTLWAPFMTAALIIQVDLGHVSVPQFRAADTGRYWFKVSRPDLFEVSPVWFVPTRRPRELRAVLASRGIVQPERQG